MADIQKLTTPYFTDGTTQLNAANLNPIIAKINEVIETVNGGVTPTPTDPVQDVVDKIKAKMSGVGNKETAVYNLINALGASTPTSGIWSRIKALYIPCLAITTDANNVFYDIIADTVQTDGATDSYKIEAKRGVMPTTAGDALGQVSLSGITADNTSMFAIVTQRTDTTLSSSASFVAIGNGVRLMWKANGSCVCLNANDSNKIITGAIADFASSPETFVLSAVSGGSRTFITNEGTETGNVEFTASEKYQLAGASYAATSLFALADGLTASEAETISTALQTFITAYGIECSNS